MVTLSLPLHKQDTKTLILVLLYLVQEAARTRLKFSTQQTEPIGLPCKHLLDLMENQHGHPTALIFQALQLLTIVQLCSLKLFLLEQLVETLEWIT
jgi:hypothetical protein